MFKKDYDLFKQQYQPHPKSESENRQVLGFYAFLLKHEQIDSDFWTCGGHDWAVDLLEKFNTKDWQDLEIDLPLWTDWQKELFIDCLVQGHERYPPEDPFNITEKRSEVLTRMYTYVSHKLKGLIVENVHYVALGGPKPLAILLQMKADMETHRYFDSNGERMLHPNMSFIDAAIAKAK